jgi:hypothetical protein
LAFALLVLVALGAGGVTASGASSTAGRPAAQATAAPLNTNLFHRVYVPFIEHRLPPTPTPTPTVTPTPTAVPTTPDPLPGDSLLYNGDFEVDWGTEGSHRCLVFETDGRIYRADIGNIFTPPGWTVWFKHGKPVEHNPWDQNGWSQPEVRDVWARDFDYRVISGKKAQVLFTFYRVHDAGSFQQVSTTPGQRLRLSGWAHAWSSTQDDGRCSDGGDVGCSGFFALSGEPGLDGDEMNFTFRLGIDPYGGTNPFADTVHWGWGAHIYNAYYPVPTIEATAQSSTVTVFLRSTTLWPFKHNDAYWDHIALEPLRQRFNAPWSISGLGDTIGVLDAEE